MNIFKLKIRLLKTVGFKTSINKPFILLFLLFIFCK